MIFSRTSQYAIQTLIYFALQPRGVPVLNRDIAENLGVPAAYLAKITQNLVRGGLLRSVRGRNGGFQLPEGGEATDLMAILTLIEGPNLGECCVMGFKVCHDETACPMHHEWQPIKARILQMLHGLTLGSLAAAVRSGQYRLSELPGSALPPTSGARCGR